MLSALAELHPRKLYLATLKALAPSERDSGWWRILPGVLLPCLIGAALSRALGNPFAFQAFLMEIGHDLSPAGADFRLAQAAWGLAIQLIGQVAIPLAFAWVFLKKSPRQLGLGWADSGKAMPAYLVLFVIGAVASAAASFAPAFQSAYPAYRWATRSWFDFLASEGIVGLNYLPIEFFYRGFLIFALAEEFGAWSVVFAAVPYFLNHHAKPWSEMLLSLPYGIFLGALAVRARSVWAGILTHACMAWVMDLSAIAQTGHWIQPVFWP